MYLHVIETFIMCIQNRHFSFHVSRKAIGRDSEPHPTLKAEGNGQVYLQAEKEVSIYRRLQHTTSRSRCRSGRPPERQCRSADGRQCCSSGWCSPPLHRRSR